MKWHLPVLFAVSKHDTFHTVNTPLNEKGIKETQNKPMETTT